MWKEYNLGSSDHSTTTELNCYCTVLKAAIIFFFFNFLVPKSLEPQSPP